MGMGKGGTVGTLFNGVGHSASGERCKCKGLMMVAVLSSEFFGSKRIQKSPPKTLKVSYVLRIAASALSPDQAHRSSAETTDCVLIFP